MDDRLLNFDVQIVGDLVPYDSTKSIARCRVFYKYENRNGTYITDEFADKLVASLPYTPVKGIYDYEDGDYTDHGKKRSMGRIYGVVPVENHFAYEKHLDKDGIEREYACTDALIYTGLYKEAGEIIHKSQSMELDKNSIKGEWKTINGMERFVYTDGCFLGLQALGDAFEPCFEGAAFYSLKDAFKSLLNDVYEYDLKNKSKGDKTMFNFETENKNYSPIWTVLNPNYTEEGNWTVDTNLLHLWDDHIVTTPINGTTYTNRTYTINTDEEGNVTYNFGEPEAIEAMFVSAEEKAAIEAMKEANGGTYENLTENFVKKEEFEQKTAELNGTISTLQTEKENFEAQYADLKAQFEAMKTEFEAVQATNKEYEDVQKKGIVEKYSKLLDEEAMKPYVENLSNYTIINLEKDLAYELVKADDSIFSKKTSEDYVPTDDGAQLSALEQALSKHSK